jgi:hypothetical protein
VIRHLATAAALGTALAVAPTAQAQSSLPGAAAIAAAHHAVDATDAHTAAMTGGSGSDASVRGSRIVASAAPTTSTASTASTQSRVASPKAASTKAAPATAATAATDSVAQPKAGKNVMSFSRETYSYAGGGRRDPFKSLLAAGGDLRPLMSDLRLVTIVYAANGQNSVAILRDLTTKEQYRVHVGQTLGRMKVSSIEPRQITFTIEEFGYSRQETLMYNDPSTMRPK